MCRDCVELGVEISYTGEEFEYPSSYPRDPAAQFADVKQFIRDSIYPHLGWMSSLKSLVLTKLGPFANTLRSHVQSFMLDDLLTWLFSEQTPPCTLRHLWIQDFCFQPRFQTVRVSAPSLKSYQIEEYDNETNGEAPAFAAFPRLEFVAKIEFSNQCLLLHLPNLKYAQGSCTDENEAVS